jgi:Alpha 1,4-glycosyltransferase conserved region
VLRLAEDSPALPELLHPFRERVTPEWLPLRARLIAKLGELTRGKADLGRLPWGSTGPQALTALARKYSLMSEALPQDVFYPVTWQRAGWILDPRIALHDVVSERTVAIHLWNECIRTFKDKPAPEGSFLHRLQREAATWPLRDGS